MFPQTLVGLLDSKIVNAAAAAKVSDHLGCGSQSCQQKS